MLPVPWINDAYIIGQGFGESPGVAISRMDLHMSGSRVDSPSASDAYSMNRLRFFDTSDAEGLPSMEPSICSTRPKRSLE